MAGKMVLHCGGNAATLDQVCAVPTPPPSRRGALQARDYVPLAHEALYTAVRDALPYGVLEANHALDRDGARYFGLLTLDKQYNDRAVVIGLRNAHDGSYPASIALGESVFVCDNLAFSGTVNVARKHTRNVYRDLPALVARAVGMLDGAIRSQDSRVCAYKSCTLGERIAKGLILEAFMAGAITERQIKTVLQHYLEPPHEEFREPTAWSLHNAFTETFKPEEGAPTRLATLPTRTIRLQGVLDAVAGI